MIEVFLKKSSYSSWRLYYKTFFRFQVTKKERPPMQEYVRKLIYKDLSKTTTEKVKA